jgi:hypothetical protein
MFTAFILALSILIQCFTSYGKTAAYAVEKNILNNIKNANILNNLTFYGYDENGNPSGGYYIDETTGSPTVYTIEYDETGSLVTNIQKSKYTYAKDNVKFEAVVYTYNSDGNILSEKKYLPMPGADTADFSADSLYMSFENINSYAASTGKITAHRECTYTSDGTPTTGSEFRYTYNEFGNIVVKKNYKVDGLVKTLSSTTQNLYTADGKILSETNLYYDTNSKIVWDSPKSYETVTLYDESGKKTGTKKYNFYADGTKYEYVKPADTTSDNTTNTTVSTSPPIKYEYFYEYDESGRTTFVAVYADSKPYTENYYSYDEIGNRLSEEYYAYHGDEKYLSYRYNFTYGDKSNLAEKKYSDYYYANDVLYLNYQTINEYDEKNRITAKKFHTYFNDETINWAKSYEYFYTYNDEHITEQDFYVYDKEKNIIWDDSYENTYDFGDNGSLVQVIRTVDDTETDYGYEEIPDLSEEVIVIHYGDCNCDGKVSIVDLVELCKHIVGAETLMGQGLINSDCDGDGNLALEPTDAEDSIALARFLVKKTRTLPEAQD